MGHNPFLCFLVKEAEILLGMLDMLLEVKIPPISNALQFLKTEGKLIFDVPCISRIMRLFLLEMLADTEVTGICSVGCEPFNLLRKPIRLPLVFYDAGVKAGLDGHPLRRNVFFLHLCREDGKRMLLHSINQRAFLLFRMAKILDLHLLKFSGTEEEIPGRDLITEGLSDLGDAKGELQP